MMSLFPSTLISTSFVKPACSNRARGIRIPREFPIFTTFERTILFTPIFPFCNYIVYTITGIVKLSKMNAIAVHPDCSWIKTGRGATVHKAPLIMSDICCDLLLDSAQLRDIQPRDQEPIAADAKETPCILNGHLRDERSIPPILRPHLLVLPV